MGLKNVSQGLKPGSSLEVSSARLKSCPDTRRLWLAVACVGFFVCSAYGQTAPENQNAPAAAEQAPSLSTDINEVGLDLAVHDKKHKAVLDLKPDDFVVMDNNVPVKLTGFRLVSGPEAASKGHMITLLFDPFHGPTARSARNIAEKVMAVLPTTGYSFSVLDFTGRLRLIQGFTQDRSQVEQAIHVVTESEPISMTTTLSLAMDIVMDANSDADKAKAVAAAEKNVVATAQTGVDVTGRHVDAKERAQAQALLTALNQSQAIWQEQKGPPTLAALLALVKSQQGMGDRKALIYFTVNRRLDLKSKKLLTTIAGAAADAGVTIYTVDMEAINQSKLGDTANAMMNAAAPADIPAQASATPKELLPQAPPAGAGSAGGVQNGGFGSGGYVWTQQDDIRVMTDFSRNGFEDLTDPFADSQSPMAAFSKATGGAYIDGQNPTTKPLAEMAEDLATYYVASYVPPFKEYDGKFRTISVKPLRAGLNIQTKTGYFALAAGSNADIQPFEGPLQNAFNAAELPKDLKFHAAVLRFGDLPNGNSNTMAVEVPLAELATTVDGNSHVSTAHVSIVAQIRDTSGTVVEHYSEDVKKRGAKETLERDGSATIALERHFISGPGKYTMEVAVLDQNSGKAGAIRRDFEIPDLTGVVSVSDMVLVRTKAADDGDPLEPLRYQHAKVTPNLTGELPANAKDASFFLILHPDPASDEPVKLEMELIRNGKAGPRTALLEADGEHTAMSYMANVKAGTLPPGDYEVKAFLKQGAKTAEQSGKFRVRGTAGAADVDAGSLEMAGLSEGAAGGTLEGPPHAPNQLAIAALTTPVAALAQDEVHQLIEGARERALSYNESLPNFECTEVTKRAVDSNGDGKWRSIDSLVEMLSYQDRVETRTTLELNGNASHTDRGSMKGIFSSGEFGGILQAVFRESSKAEFKWKEAASLNGAMVQVFDYRVDRGNSSFSVTGLDGKQMIVGFSGQVFIDSNTRRVRRVTLKADDLPANIPTQSTAMDVDYDYVAINGLKYLMPVSAELDVKKGPREALTNTMEFRDFKRFGSN
ncbi:MAG: VWA domain-containing protein [Terracidiphilus sp.]|jgi:VWFA-related protein